MVVHRQRELVLLVTDARSGRPVPRVAMFVAGRAIPSGESDSAGMIRIVFRETEPELEFRREGYHGLRLALQELPIGSTDTIQVRLRPWLLNELVVASPDFWGRPSQTMSRDDSLSISRALADAVRVRDGDGAGEAKLPSVADERANTWTALLAESLGQATSTSASQGDSVQVSFVSRIADTTVAGLIFEDCRGRLRTRAMGWLYTLHQSGGTWSFVSRNLRLTASIACSHSREQ